MQVAGREDALILSPMVDVTDAAFRSLASEWGANVTCSEMVSAAGLVGDNRASWRLVEPWPGESPYGVQIMGGEAAVVADAVRCVGQAHTIDFIDLNLGCPSPRVLAACAGAFLLRDPPLVGRVVAAAKEAADDVGIPHVSVKMRTGHDHDHLTYFDVGEEAQAAGASWATLHGRTVVQGYSGAADWNAIGRLVERLDIPVVGNGDIRGPRDVVAMRDATGCSGFFIARAAMHDPTIFRRLRQALNGEKATLPPTMEERRSACLTYLQRARRIGLDNVGLLGRQAMRFLHGQPGAKRMRLAVQQCRTRDEIEALMRLEATA